MNQLSHEFELALMIDSLDGVDKLQYVPINVALATGFQQLLYESKCGKISGADFNSQLDVILNCLNEDDRRG